MEDLRNLCSKVDVDAIRGKIPPMPQIKLPKSVSKIKSGKLFHISREDFSSISRRSSSKRTAAAKTENIPLPQGAPYSIPVAPPSGIINRTPTRISTISSLINKKSTRSNSSSDGSTKGSKMWHQKNNLEDDDENSYRNAGGIDDYCPSPLDQRFGRMSQPISPLKAPHSANELNKTRSVQNVKMSLGDKLQKSYKDFSSFKVKHIFAKRTIVHTDKIEVQNYIESFNQDRIREEKVQQKIDRDIADNYRFRFKVAQQKSEDTYLDFDDFDSSPENSKLPNNRKVLSDLSGDESGMESSPPKRVPGIASTRFSRVRHSPINMSLEENYRDDNNVQHDKSNNLQQQNTRKSTQQNSAINLSQEEVADFDDDGMEIEFEESPKKRPKNQSSRQSPRRKSAKGTSATVSSKNCNAAVNRTQEELLDDDEEGDIEFNDKEEVEYNKNSSSSRSPLKKSAKCATIIPSSIGNRSQEEDINEDGDADIEFCDVDTLEMNKEKPNKASSQDNKKQKSGKFQMAKQNLRKSVKGMTSSAAFTKDRQTAINKTQEDELDISSDGGIDDLPEHKIKKSAENVKISRQKSVKGHVASNAFSKERQAAFNKTQEDELDMSSDGGGIDELYEYKHSKPSDNIQISRQKSINGIAKTNAFTKDGQGPLNKTQEDELDISSDGGIDELYDNKKGKSSQNIRLSRQKSTKGIAITNTFSKDRQGPLNRTQEDELDVSSDGLNDMSDDIELNIDEEMESPKLKPNSSTLYDIKSKNSNENLQKSKSIKERMSRFTKQKIDDNESNKVVAEKRRRASQTSDQSLDNDGAKKSDKPFENMKQNFKRIQKSIKIPQHMKLHSGSISENDDPYTDDTKKPTKTQQLSENNKRFRSSDNIDKTSEDDEHNKSHNITNKIQGWTKSIKKKVDSHNVDNNDDYGSPQKQSKPAGSLMNKLKHIRTRKRTSDDPDDDEEGGDTYKESLASRAKLQLEKGAVAASLMPQLTMKKLSETKKYFKKKQDESDTKKKNPNIANTDEEDLDDDKVKTSPKCADQNIPTRPPPPIPRPFFNNGCSDEDDDDNEEFVRKSIAESKLIALPAATTVWATKPILLDDTDYEEDLPRVVLHQDNSNLFEPTLIIAVTRPMSTITTSPIITELTTDSAEESTADTKPDNWIPNQDKVASFLNMTPPSERKLQKNVTSETHSRKESIDFSSDDSWIKDIPKGPSTVPDIKYENENPWKIQKDQNEDKLYKTKSVDLFELQKQQGGVLCAFEDFDDELRYSPVVKIEKEINNADETETDDNEEFKDFDEVYQTTPADKTIENNKNSTVSKMETEEFKDFDESPSNPIDKKEMDIINFDKIEIKNTLLLNIETEIFSNSIEYNEKQALVEKIHRNVDDYQRESSEEVENDDNSSAVTKISVHMRDPQLKSELKSLTYGNSRESLTDNLDDKGVNESAEEYNSEESDIDKDFKAKEVVTTRLLTSNIPSTILPNPAPPLPQRMPPITLPSQSDLEFEYTSLPAPPLPLTRPPLPPNKPLPVPPKVPIRIPAKPLVKTGSLRLTFNEQVHPKDVGKVNKLISQFEAEVPIQRPRVVPRKPYISDESDDSSDNEDLIELCPKTYKGKIRNFTAAKAPITQKSLSLDSIEDNISESDEENAIKIYSNNIPDKRKSISNETSRVQNIAASFESADIPDNNKQNSECVKILESQQKSIHIQDEKYKFRSIDRAAENKYNKSTISDISDIKLNSVSTDSSNNIITCKDISSATVNDVSNSTNQTFVETPNDEEKSTTNNILDKKRKSISNETSRIQNRATSIDLADTPDNNKQNSECVEILESQQKSFYIQEEKYKFPSIDRAENKYNNKSTISDISDIKLKSVSIDSSNNNTTICKEFVEEQKILDKKYSIDDNVTTIPHDTSMGISNNISTKSKDNENYENPYSENIVNVVPKDCNNSLPNEKILLMNDTSKNIDSDGNNKTKQINIPKISKKPVFKDLKNTPDEKLVSSDEENYTKSALNKIIDKNNEKFLSLDIAEENENIILNDIAENNGNNQKLDNHEKKPVDIDNKTTLIDKQNIQQKTIVESFIPKVTDDIPYNNDKQSKKIDIQSEKAIKENILKNNNDDFEDANPIPIPDNNDNISTPTRKINAPRISTKTSHEVVIDSNKNSAQPISKISIYSSCMDINSNVSQPGSRYGSPEAYPTFIMHSREATPLANRKESEYFRCPNRLQIDEDNFNSFESDEENSYYSISSTSSNRYVVDL